MADMIIRAFAAGWGGAVTKTITLQPPSDLQLRLHPLRYHKRNMGMENVELISELSVEIWKQEILKIKAIYPERPLWASIMAAPVKEHWQRLVQSLQETSIDAFELNVSCPHGMPSKGMEAIPAQVLNQLHFDV